VAEEQLKAAMDRMADKGAVADMPVADAEQ
jgi:hypothetical protein